MIGEFARSLSGHDKDKIYVILSENGEYVYLCDGNIRKIASPKKKSRKHIQVIHQETDTELQQKLLRQEVVYDHEIKYAIKQYMSRSETTI